MRNVRVILIFMTSIMAIMMIGMVSLYYKVSVLDSRIGSLEARLIESESTDKEMLENLKSIRDRQEEVKRLEIERAEKEKQRTIALNRIKSEGIGIYTDLGDQLALNADDMNKLIDKWTEHMGKQSVLKGHGEAFIIASQETGLNPIYILAHAIEESGCGTSYLAVTRNNFFGINAVDSNPGKAYTMGDDVDEGVVAGAMWIKKNYYDRGYTTLASMKAAGYATNDSWSHNIASIANASIRYL